MTTNEQCQKWAEAGLENAVVLVWRRERRISLQRVNLARNVRWYADKIIAARRQLRVTASHVCERFACTDAPVRIGRYLTAEGRTLYYAEMAGYGCGKNYRTPHDAIYGLLEDHACTDITITGEYDPAEFVQL